MKFHSYDNMFNESCATCHRVDTTAQQIHISTSLHLDLTLQPHLLDHDLKSCSLPTSPLFKKSWLCQDIDSRREILLWFVKTVRSCSMCSAVHQLIRSFVNESLRDCPAEIAARFLFDTVHP